MKKTAAAPLNESEKNPKSRFYLFLFLFGIFFANHTNAGTVTNINNSGAGSLRAVITAATAGETINFSPTLLASGSTTITLSSEIAILVPLTINGLINGSDTLYISGNNTTRIFICDFPTLSSGSIITLNNLVLINGNGSGSDGGAILFTSGELRVTNCIFRGNSGVNGSAICYLDYSQYGYELNINRSTFQTNSASGTAAIYSSSATSVGNTVQTTITNSTINNNSAATGASAVYCRSTVNSTTQYHTYAYLYINQSTICNNSGTSYGVEVYGNASNNSTSTGSAYAYITNSTLVSNGTNAIRSSGTTVSTITVSSSIVLNNITNNRTPVLNSLGKNLFSGATLTGSHATDVFGVSLASASLGALAFNGGTTKTRMPLQGSIAINNGSTSLVQAQNGALLGVRDIGAAENRSTYGTHVVTNCGPYTWINGLTYNSSNTTATHTLVNTAGNDSIVTLNLTVRPIYNVAKSATICPGNSYSFGTQTLTTAGNYVEVFNSIHGCDSTVNLTLSVADNTAPVKNVANLPAINAQCSVTTLTAPTATDNCAGTITGTHNATLPITTPGTTVVTWTYSDGNGNSSTQTQNIVINDLTAPTANTTTLPTISENCSVSSLTAPTATDNCSGTITGTHNATLPITAQGITVVTWTYTDGNGNTSTQTQNVIISDNVAPVANTAFLADITNSCSVNVLIPPTATDNCAGTITGTHNASLPITTQGTTVITWTYNDGHGNTSTQTQNVIIEDQTAPVTSLANLPVITSQCPVTSLTAPIATDNCAGTITGTHNTTLPITAQGTTVVTWTYNDGHGNTSTQTQNVIINDNTAPVANLASLANITNQCSVTSLTAPTATDNCAGTIIGTHNATLPITASGTTVVTWTYSDGNGNSSTQTQNVIIADNIAPVASTANLSNVTGQCSVTSLTAPTAADNCAGTITGTHNVTLPITTPGTTVVTWTYSDGHGNTSTQTQNVIVTLPIATTTLSGLTISATTSGATYQWINCGTGNTPIAGATAQTFTATANGTYAVIVTQNGCSATSACVAISTVGITEEETNTLSIFPNPANDQFTLFNTREGNSFQLADNAGKIVFQGKTTSKSTVIHTENLVNGLYFIQLTENGSTFTGKFIVNH